MSSSSSTATLVASVRASLGGAVGLHEALVFVDYREENAEQSKPFLEALASARVADYKRPVVRSTMGTADVIIALVVEAPAPGSDADAENPDDDDGDDDEDARAAVATTRALHARLRTIAEELDAKVNVAGVAPSALLADARATALVPVLAYERKTLSDFTRSVQGATPVPKKQHFDDQRVRMLAFAEATGARPRLLVEGYLEATGDRAVRKRWTGAMAEEAVHSMFTRMDLRDGISIYQTADTDDSARLVLKDAAYVQAKRLSTERWYRLPRSASDTLLAVKKAENDDAAVYYVNVLQAMLSVSKPRAQAIAARFPSIPELCEALKAPPTEKARAALVADIVVGKRRLGIEIAKRVLARYGPSAVKYAAVPPTPTNPSSSSSSTMSTTTTAAAVAPPAPKRAPKPKPTTTAASSRANAAPTARRALTFDDDDDDDDDDDEIIVTAGSKRKAPEPTQRDDDDDDDEKDADEDAGNAGSDDDDDDDDDDDADKIEEKVEDAVPGRRRSTRAQAAAASSRIAAAVEHMARFLGEDDDDDDDDDEEFDGGADDGDAAGDDSGDEDDDDDDDDDDDADEDEDEFMGYEENGAVAAAASDDDDDDDDDDE
jgi:ERCC4-type nuclease